MADDLDREIVELLASGLSYRAAAAEIGRSLGFVQRAVRRFEDARVRLLASVAAQGLHADDADMTERLAAGLSPLERWRWRHVEHGTTIPLHDDDHRACCVAHGLDPEWRPQEYASDDHLSWPRAAESDWDD